MSGGEVDALLVEMMRQRRSYGLAIAWPIVVCVSIQAQAAVLV